MKILDTNFVCSLFNQSDFNHEKALNIFFNIENDEKVKIPFVVAAELSVNENRKKYLRATKEITVKFLTNNESDLEFITNLALKSTKKLKANDCLIIALCQRLNADLLTFDKKLQKVLSRLR